MSPDLGVCTASANSCPLHSDMLLSVEPTMYADNGGRIGPAEPLVLDTESLCYTQARYAAHLLIWRCSVALPRCSAATA